MNLQASWCKHTLNFKFKAGTSRGSMLHKTSYFLKIWDKINQFDAQKGRLFTWMLNLTRNAAIDKIKMDLKYVFVIKGKRINKLFIVII